MIWSREGRGEEREGGGGCVVGGCDGSYFVGSLRAVEHVLVSGHLPYRRDNLGVAAIPGQHCHRTKPHPFLVGSVCVCVCVCVRMYQERVSSKQKVHVEQRETNVTCNPIPEHTHVYVVPSVD